MSMSHSNQQWIECNRELCDAIDSLVDTVIKLNHIDYSPTELRKGLLLCLTPGSREMFALHVALIGIATNGIEKEGMADE